MDIFLSQSEIIKTLNKHQTASIIKANLPILSNILLETENGVLQMTTTDLDLGVITKTEAQIQQQTSVSFLHNFEARRTPELPKLQWKSPS